MKQAVGYRYKTASKPGTMLCEARQSDRVVLSNVVSSG